MICLNKDPNPDSQIKILISRHQLCSASHGLSPKADLLKDLSVQKAEAKRQVQRLAVPLWEWIQQLK